MSMEWGQIWNKMNEQKLVGFDHNQHPIMLSSDMSLVEKKWLLEDFPPLLLANQQQAGMDKYVVGRNPCGIFAMRALVLARELHFISSQKLTGLMFGMVCFTQDETRRPELPTDEERRHAINVALVQNKEPGDWDGLEFVFFDPQPRQQWFMTEPELTSITGSVL